MSVDEWAERWFYIEDPINVADGTYEQLLPGPIQLMPYQKAILRACLEIVPDKGFRWQTIVYSAIKKSGKSRLAAMAGAWAADQADLYAEVYLAANDGQQSEDRLLSCIKKAIDLNPDLGWVKRQTRVELPGGSFIQAIPVDPTGQAGANPTAVLFSEMWGYQLEHKQRLWTAMTLSPVRRGMSFRWVDTYAGYIGESPILEALYKQSVVEGRPYIDWADENNVEYDPLLRELELPIFIDEPGRLFVYWETEPRMPFQTPDYYEEQAGILPEIEFRRIHKNEWVTSEDVFIPMEWWYACEENLPPVTEDEMMVLGVDAAVSGDSFAVVGVTRHPERHGDIAVRLVGVWYPPKGGKMQFKPIEEEIKRMCQKYRVVEVAYDQYQLHRTATEMRAERVANWKVFGQSHPRLTADTQLYQLIREGRIAHYGDPELSLHIKNANAKLSVAEDNKMRLIKGRGKIDAVVALSMACHRALYLNI